MHAGVTVKIVLAEKVSPATLAIFQKEPGWNVVTADKITSLPDELADAMRSRRRERGPDGKPNRPAQCDLVVLDDSYQLRMKVPDLAGLLREGPAAGIYFICLDGSPAQLPPECGRAVSEIGAR